MTVLRRLRRAWPAVVGIVALIVAVALLWAWRTPSGYFVLWPDKAHPAADYLHVPDGKPPASGTGFYFVDVHELEANKLEEFWGRHLVNGATLIPDREVVVPGESEKQRVKQDFQAMDTSQLVAEAVAEKALGRNVVIRHLGALVEQVSPGLPAAKAGVEAGEVITAVDGHRVRSAQDLIRFTGGLDPGDSAAYTFGHEGTKRLRTVASSDGKHRAIIGVAIGDDIRIGHIPVKVHYTIRGIGGPSAGLAFALEIYRSLSPDRGLLEGHKIAATGELELSGRVLPIGGARQKAIGAIDAGADTFLVPAGANAHDARAAAHGRLRIIAVRSFRGALAAIRGLKPA
jgi:Lon-like protease